MLQPIVGFAGMSHLGINTAVATAERGFNTICYDRNESLIDQLKQQKLSIIEPELPELLEKNTTTNRLIFSSDVSQLYNCDIVYISCDDITGNIDNIAVIQLTNI